MRYTIYVLKYYVPSTYIRVFVLCSAHERRFAAKHKKKMSENLEENFDIELFIGEIKNHPEIWNIAAETAKLP